MSRKRLKNWGKAWPSFIQMVMNKWLFRLIDVERQNVFGDRLSVIWIKYSSATIAHASFSLSISWNIISCLRNVENQTQLHHHMEGHDAVWTWSPVLHLIILYFFCCIWLCFYTMKFSSLCDSFFALSNSRHVRSQLELFFEKYGMSVGCKLCVHVVIS